MITFELTMPCAASWNHAWSGSGRTYIRCRRESEVPKSLWDNDFQYVWEDGWTANISVRKTDARTARKLQKNSAGFCGYDWMITSLITHGRIIPPSETQRAG